MTENDEWKSSYGLIIICNYMSSLAAARLARHVQFGNERTVARCISLPSPLRGSLGTSARPWTYRMRDVFAYSDELGPAIRPSPAKLQIEIREMLSMLIHASLV